MSARAVVPLSHPQDHRAWSWASFSILITSSLITGFPSRISEIVMHFFGPRTLTRNHFRCHSKCRSLCLCNQNLRGPDQKCAKGASDLHPSHDHWPSAQGSRSLRPQLGARGSTHSLVLFTLVIFLIVLI